jgi:hypothetical protein
VEWADRLGDRLPSERLELTIQPALDGGDTRHIEWRATGSHHVVLASEALANR